MKPDKLNFSSEKYQNIANELVKLSSDNYYEHVFKFSEETYRERVNMMGFENMNCVLDAGCGYGQWSVALAEKNRSVVAIDRSELMIESSKIMAKEFKVENIEFQTTSFPPIPYHDTQFDGIWCWSVFQFLQKDTALKEFHRVLKPGGRIAFGAVNSYGRWLFKLVNNTLTSKPNLTAAKICWGALRRGKNSNLADHVTTIKSSKLLAEKFGFKFVQAADDGYLDVHQKGREFPMCERRYLGFENNIEFIFEKI